MEVIIRADSNKKIGTGHIVRAINLNKFFLSKKINSKIISRTSSEILKFNILHKNYFIRIRKYISLEEEKKTIFNILKKAEQPVFILDVLNYAYYQEFVIKLKKYGIETILICDHKKKVSFSAKVIINANPYQSKFKYPKNKTTYLTGHQYMIMNPSYRRIKRKNINKKISKIIVSVGGTDQKDMIYQVIDLIEKSILKSKVSIYSSSSSKKYISKLEKYLNRNKYKNSYRILLDEKKFYNVWWKNDIAITASGNTLFERIASGLPGASISQFSQQFYIAKEFDTMGLNCNLNFNSRENRLNHDKFIKFLTDKKIIIEQIKKLKKNSSSDGIFQIYKEILKLNR